MGEGHTRRLQAILAADVVGYSRLMGRDEEGTLRRLKALEHDRVDPAIAGHGGEVVKRLGDGLLAVFPSAVTALRAARTIQSAVAEDQAGEAAPIAYRIGLNVGDVLVAENDIFGDGVNVAARLEGLADPGGITLSAAVLDNVRAQDPGPFDDLGERPLKNIDHPVRVYRVHLPGSPPLATRGAGAAGWRRAVPFAVLGLLAAALLAWLLWPDPPAPVESAQPAPPEPSAPVVGSPRSTAPAPAPAPTTGTAVTAPPVTAPGPAADATRDAAEPAAAPTAEAPLERRLLESVLDAVEQELSAPSGSPGGRSKQKVPPGQAKKQ